MRSCWRCGTVVASDSIGVRDTCAKCQAFLHCCRNCEFYSPGAHNDCREPKAEVVADKEQGNFCDEFRFATARAAATSKEDDARARLDKLFRR